MSLGSGARTAVVFSSFRAEPMNEMIHRYAPRAIFVAMVATALPPSLLPAQQPAPAPRAGIVLKDRHGHATPERVGATHCGGGNTDVSQARDDTVVITMTGVAVAGPHPTKASAAALHFDLHQAFDIVFTDHKVKKAKLT